MAIDGGDLRDRFKRADYSSLPLKPRPGGPTQVSEITNQPNRALESSQNAAQATEAVTVKTTLMRAGNGSQSSSDSPMAAAQEPSRQAGAAGSNERPQTSLPTRKIFVESSPEGASVGTLNDTPEPELNGHHRRDRRQKSEHKSKTWLIITPMVLLLLAGANFAAWTFLKHKNDNLLPADYTSQSLGFVIYYPKDLPDGFRVAPNSFTTKDSAMIFYIDTPDGKNLPVSEQAIPDGSTADQLVPAPSNIKVTEAEDISIPGAKSSYAVIGEQTLTSIVIDKTWIIINSTSTSKDNAVAVAKAFKKIDK